MDNVCEFNTYGGVIWKWNMNDFVAIRISLHRVFMKYLLAIGELIK